MQNFANSAYSAAVPFHLAAELWIDLPMYNMTELMESETELEVLPSIKPFCSE